MNVNKYNIKSEKPIERWDEAFPLYHENPVDLLDEFFNLDIPVFLVAGGADEAVPLRENGEKMIERALRHNARFSYIVKNDCGHRPHSLDDVGDIVRFVVGDEDGEE